MQLRTVPDARSTFGQFRAAIAAIADRPYLGAFGELLFGAAEPVDFGMSGAADGVTGAVAGAFGAVAGAFGSAVTPADGPVFVFAGAALSPLAGVIA